MAAVWCHHPKVDAGTMAPPEVSLRVKRTLGQIFDLMEGERTFATDANGDLKYHRLRSPFVGNTAAWMMTSEDGSQAVIFHFQVLSRPNPPSTILRLRALDPDARYHVAELDQTFGGDVLMNAGLQFPDATHDFASHMWRLTKV